MEQYFDLSPGLMVASIRGSAREIVRQAGLLKNQFQSIGSPSLCHALVELDSQGEMNIAKLSSILGLDHSTTSRLVDQMVREEVCVLQIGASDRRNKLISLTKKGAKLAARIHDEAKAQVQEALDLMDPSEKDKVVEGLSIYAKALRRANLQKGYKIRRLLAKDVPQLIQLTKSIWAEFGFDGAHSAAPIYEAELEKTYEIYSAKKAAYFVLVQGDTVVGGAGFGPLAGEADICELKGMYLAPSTRGLGLGKVLLRYVLDEMKREGFEECYLETMNFMNQANLLYQKFGFNRLDRPKGNTGHSWTNCWYIKKL
jgi:putative acetyltransferase